MNVILQSLSASTKVTDWLIRSKAVLNSLTTSPSSTLLNTLANTVACINRLDETSDEQQNDTTNNSSSTSNNNTSTNNNNNNNNTSNSSDYDYDKDASEIYAAHFIKRALHSHNWHIESEEHDCHEFFHLLMDVLDEEQKENKLSQSSLNFFQPQPPPSHLRESSRMSVKNPFHGYLACQFQCLDCDYKYPLKLESFYVLSLTLPQQPKSTTQLNESMSGAGQNDFFASPFGSINLYECLNNYFKPEILAEMKCENCNSEPSETKKKGFIKRQAIAKLPECLCIQIQRNSWSDQSYEMIKKTNHVKFPLSIKIDSNQQTTQQPNANNTTNKNPLVTSSPIVTKTFSLKQVGLGALLGGHQSNMNRSQTSETIENNHGSSFNQSMSMPNSNMTLAHSYELRSAIVHYGSAHSGHFVAFRKALNDPSSSDEWLQISDSDIKRVKLSTLMNSNVYMLFYDKCTSLVSTNTSSDI